MSIWPMGDVFLIAPLSANTLSKMGHGQCDNLLLACYLSATCPVFVAPAMDLEMYRDASTHANLDLLRGRNVRTIGPESGELASGLIGEGRMTEPEDIVRQLHQELVGQSKLNGKRILISAGPTQEPSTRFGTSAIDPVVRWASPWPKKLRGAVHWCNWSQVRQRNTLPSLGYSERMW
jgi:phosphopantothenoylcysteine decarboxylase/phosphopantothenate--cysteine ligase